MAALPRSRALASFLAALRLSDLPPAALRLLKLCVLDHFGCALGALGTDVARVAGIAAAASRAQGAGACTVVGQRFRASAEAAALANGMLAHALVFDDIHREAKLHPGVAVIPAAFAAAEKTGADGARFLAGVAAGYEATVRVGIAVGMSGHRMRGWRATGSCGSFGAAAAAAHLAGADAPTMHQALAGAAAQACGTWAFAESGGQELYLAAGTAARNGIVAATLAACGFRGADDPLEAADGGFFAIASEGAQPDILVEGLGERFRLLDTCIKMYPTCHSTQTAVDAVLSLKARHGVAPEAVERIEVRAGEITRLQCGWPFEPGPPARMIFHLGYALATALVRGKVLPDDFEQAPLRDPERVRIARSTEVIADPELTAIYAQRKPCDVSLILRDGRTLRERVDYCRGEPENPPTEEAVVAKFRDLTAPHLPQRAADRVIEFVTDLERGTDLRQLAEALSSAGAPESNSAQAR